MAPKRSKKVESPLKPTNSRLRYPQGHPRGPSISDWRFESRIEETLREIEHNHSPPKIPVKTDAKPLYCICLTTEDEEGGEMIECSNGKNCLAQWFHTSCIGMVFLPEKEGTSVCRLRSMVYQYLSDYHDRAMVLHTLP